MDFKATDVIPTVVEAMLSRGTPDKVLHVAVEVKAWAFCPEELYAKLGEDHEGEWMEYQTVHLLFYRPQNYTLVLQSLDRGSMIMPNMEWKRTSYHDSCWRSDGLSELNQIARSVEKEVARQINKDFDGKVTIGDLPRPRMMCRIDALSLIPLEGDVPTRHDGVLQVARGYNDNAVVIQPL